MKSFESKCLKASSSTGIAVSFYHEKREDQVYEDDGTLHVLRGGVRACFDVGLWQSLSAKKQNERTTAILDFLKIKVDESISTMCMRDESDDEDES